MLTDSVRAYIGKFHMIPPGCRVLAAVSGGADSTALLMLLAELSVPMDFTLEVLHVEHGIRGEESLRDAAFVEALCRKLAVPCECVHLDVPAEAVARHKGLEETARLMRYEELRKRADAGTRIALAHHLDDNAETVLFRLARGSGLRGLGGMEPVRTDEDGLTYIRPFLMTRRAQIEAYLKERQQAYCTDSTNLEDEAARNRIRHHVLPALNGINSEAALHIARTAEQLVQVRSYIDERAEQARRQITEKEADGVIRISAKALSGLHPAISGPLIMELLAETAGRRQDLEELHVAQVLELAGLQSGRLIELPWGVRALRSYDDILLLPAEMSGKGEDREYCIPVDPEAGSCRVNTPIGAVVLEILDFCEDMAKIPKNQYNKWFDYDKIKHGLAIRTRRPGDYLLCSNAEEVLYRKKLKKYFLEEKVPAADRSQAPLLAEGALILWVIGRRNSDNYRITPDTKRVLAVWLEEVKEENDGFFSTL